MFRMKREKIADIPYNGISRWNSTRRILAYCYRWSVRLRPFVHVYVRLVGEPQENGLR